MDIRVEVERFALSSPFRIARGAKTEAVVVVAHVAADGATGRGECVPYARYDETVDSVVAQLEGLDCEMDRAALAEALPPGAARNAADAALWDWEAKRDGRPAHRVVCTDPPRPLTTAYSISLGGVGDMAEAARAAASHRVLKVKLGGRDGHDGARIDAVHSAAPDARFVFDANEGWTPDELPGLMRHAARAGALLVEQPLPADEDGALAGIPHPVPVCADESAHASGGLGALVGRYDFVNIKLDKTGGLTEALATRRRARELGFGVMVGCMVGTSLAMAPAVLLAQEADVVDLDGPLLLARDRPHGLGYSGSLVSPPSPALWG